MSAKAARGRKAAKKPAEARSEREQEAASAGPPAPPEYNMLLTATLCLLAFGAVMVFSASSTTRILQDGGLSDSAFYLKRTLLFGAVGLTIMYFVSRGGGLQLVRRATPVLLAGSIFLLCAVLVAGTEVNGATRWLGGGFLQIQPSELAKVALILYGADLLAQKPKRVRSLEGIMPFLLVVGASCLLIMLQPDMGTTMVIVFSVAAMLISAGDAAASTSARSAS